MKEKKIYMFKIADIGKPLIRAINHATKLKGIKRRVWMIEAIKEKLEREGIEIKPEPEGDHNEQ